MAQVINTNLAAINAQRNLSSTQGSMQTAIQRLSSGLRVNSAKDDAAGLSIASRMDAQARGMSVAIRNASDGISMAQVAEGALGKVSDMLQRMRELAIQSANATNNSTDRDSLNAEYAELSEEIGRTVSSTRFNGGTILASTTAMEFQIGASNDTSDRLTVAATDLSASMAAVAATSVTGTDSSNARLAIDALDSAMTTINSKRAEFGAIQNRFEAVISNLQIAAENQQSSRSRIMDADFAAETAAMTRAQILQQAGTAMLAQANQLPQQVLRLLQN
jgi:flagellin